MHFGLRFRNSKRLYSTSFKGFFLFFFPCNQETEDANKVDEKQVSEATDSEEKRDKTKEELEKESTEAKEDEKKSSTDLKELEPVSSKTKGPTVSIDIFLAA